MLKQILSRSGLIARGVLDDFRQLLSPPLCIGCDRDLAAGDPVFCNACLESLNSKCAGTGPVCPFCGWHDLNNRQCRFCSKSFKIRLYYWGRYEDELVQYIGKFKFQGVLELGIRLTDEALKRLANLLCENYYDYVIPVPLHGSRRRKRDYNQSDIIAKIVSMAINAIYIPDSIFRVRSTRQQAKIKNEDRRWKNVENAFSLTSGSDIDFNRKKVLIVDDIVTTGATIYEVSKPIREKDPEMIDVFSLAYAG